MPTRINHLQLKLLLPFLVVLLTISTIFAQQTDTTKLCGSEISHEQLMNSSNQGFKTRYRKFAAFAKDYVQGLTILSRDSGIADDRSFVITIPVVVHIVSSPGMPFISDAQVNSQIDALNRDFRKMNADATTIPSAFAPLAADCHIEFRLAVRGPGCVPTTGITRTSTTVAAFATPATESEYHELAFNPVKSTAAGGHDAWSSQKYLNIWVCNFERSGLLGYSSFPTDLPEVDGVAMSYRAFGTIGTVAAPFNLGRVTVHEVGHWLNVFHIWGDDWNPATPSVIRCDGSDEVDDTPNQGKPNNSIVCPTFPTTSACGSIVGDMYMNYMDYTTDPCRKMFTIGQSQRMDATLYGARLAILSSDALTPVSAAGDLYMQDFANYPVAPGIYVTDDGTEPSGSTVIQDMAHSQDIWIRPNLEVTPIEEHRDPVYRPASSLSPNYVYVKVRNRGCTGASLSGNLKLYWTHASSGSLVWPTAWNGSDPRTGGTIGTPTPVTVAPGVSTVVRFEWYPPNPADYLIPGTSLAESKHFCLLARLETSSTPPYGMSYPEVAGDINALWQNVNNNNNIVWKNIAVENEATGLGTTTTFVAGNSSNNMIMSKFYFRTIENIHQQHLLKYGNVIIKLGTDLYNKWKLGGKKSSGVTELNDSSLLIRSKDAWIDSLKFNPKEVYGMKVNFQYAKKIPFGNARSLEFKIEQTAYDSTGQEIKVGTETYNIKSLNWEPNINRIRVKLRGLLEGTYRAEIALMLDSLRTKGLIPIVTPYQAPQFLPVNNPVLEVIDPAVLQVSGPQAITDWVWIELRDSLDNKKVLSTRSALIRRDGEIVDLDGVSPLSFRNLPNGGYYIVLRHRNHLGIMTAGTRHLTGNDTTSIDFTKPTTLTYGSKAQKTVGNITVMWAGNANGDGTIKYNGSSNDKTFILSKVGLTTPNKVLVIYDGADTNLDGSVKYNGAANDKNVILANVGLTTPNNIIVQQLP